MPDTIQEIVEAVGDNFRCFGGGHDSDFNPLTKFLKDEPLQFAAGVGVEEVVRFVLKLRSNQKRRVNARLSR